MIKKLLIILFILFILSITVTTAISLFSDETVTAEQIIDKKKSNKSRESREFSGAKLTIKEIDSLRAISSMDRAIAENLPPNYYAAK